MKASIVIGANYGDEGKGTVVARLAKANTNVLNILTNGGAQRGHSILTKDGSITFQHFGSGTYHGADSYYSRYYILNPMQFVEEYTSLIVKPAHIYRDPRCRWSTPYDVMANLITEEQRGRHASCGMGIWNTIQRCDHTPIMLFDDFVDNPEKWDGYLESVKSYYEGKIEIPDKWRDTWNSNGVKHHFTRDCMIMDKLTEKIELVTLKYENLIFENGQGLLLKDKGNDTFDTTPSDTGINYAMRLAHEIGVEDITAHYVTRPYLTRHGDGHLSGEAERKAIASTVDEDRTNHFNDHQGMFRYGFLDIEDLKKRIIEDARGVKFELEVTHCDEMDRISEFLNYFDKVNSHDSALI